jgi:hypothetical protein
MIHLCDFDTSVSSIHCDLEQCMIHSEELSYVALWKKIDNKNPNIIWKIHVSDELLDTILRISSAT